MKKIIIGVAFVLTASVANATENKSTFKDFVQAWAAVPGAIADHVTQEVADIKQYQKDSWANGKAQLARTKTQLTGFFSKLNLGRSEEQ